jgi:hypothetical protein
MEDGDAKEDTSFTSAGPITSSSASESPSGIGRSKILVACIFVNRRVVPVFISTETYLKLGEDAAGMDSADRGFCL